MPASGPSNWHQNEACPALSSDRMPDATTDTPKPPGLRGNAYKPLIFGVLR